MMWFLMHTKHIHNIVYCFAMTYQPCIYWTLHTCMHQYMLGSLLVVQTSYAVQIQTLNVPEGRENLCGSWMWTFLWVKASDCGAGSDWVPDNACTGWASPHTQSNSSKVLMNWAMLCEVEFKGATMTTENATNYVMNITIGWPRFPLLWWSNCILPQDSLIWWHRYHACDHAVVVGLHSMIGISVLCCSLCGSLNVLQWTYYYKQFVQRMLYVMQYRRTSTIITQFKCSMLC